MVDVIKNIFGETILTIIEIYIISIILNKNIKIKNKRYIIGLLTTLILLIINYRIHIDCLNLLLATMIIFIGCKIIFNDTFNHTLCSVILAQLLFVVAEMIFMVILTYTIHYDILILSRSSFGTLLTNMSISLIALTLIKIPLINKLFSKVMVIVDKNNNLSITIIFLISIGIINFLIANIYNTVNLVTLLIINTGFIMLLAYVLFKMLLTKNEALIAEKRNIEYKAENNALINTLNEYERLADHHRVIHHENKNQLYALKKMVENHESEEQLTNYLNVLLKEKNSSDESLVSKTKRIPSGGLQGIVYQKFVVMKKNKINYFLNISRNLKELDFKKLDIDTNVDMCKIVGVFLDNAIEEVTKLKNKDVGIELYKDDDNFCVAVSNNFAKNKDFSRIDESGYSTKGEGHGYGLSLVKEILSNNHRLENERKITSKYFTQILIVKNMK